MSIRRAVVTAAAPGQNSLPLQNVVDRDGTNKTALQLILEEIVDAGIDEICVVICPGDKSNYAIAAGELVNRVTFVEQDNPRGYGDAIFRANDFIGDERFLHLVGDHLYLSQTDRGCARQLVEIANAEDCAVSAVQSTHERLLPYFGAIGGKRVAGRHDLYEIANVLEKPTPTQAEQELVVAGLRSSHYLCLFGMHVLPPSILSDLEKALDATPPGHPVLLSPALAALASRERHLALQIDGSRYNIGVKYGLLMAQLAVALSGKDREQILTEILELVATANTNLEAVH